MSYSKNEANALCRIFFEDVKGFVANENGKFDAPAPYKRKRFEEAAGLLSGGHSFDSLKTMLLDYAKHNDLAKDTLGFVEIFEFFGNTPNFGSIEEDKDNLLVPARFYWHPRLQETSRPRRIIYDDYGNYETIEEPFFLEMKERFTVKDLHDYFIQKMPFGPFDNRAQGMWRHLLSLHDVEDLLFMVDDLYGVFLDSGSDIPPTPFKLGDHVHGARELLMRRKNICIEGGIDHVIPRTR